MPDRYGFDHLGNNVRCIQPECEAGWRIFEWDESRKKVHFLTHNLRMAGDFPSFDGETRKTNCRICSSEFEQERKRGRPRVLCYVCKPE